MFDLKKEMLEIIITNFSLNSDLKNIQGIYEANFFLEPFNLEAIEVVYLFELIKTKYELDVNKEDLINNKFINIVNIEKLLCDCKRVDKSRKDGS